MQRATLDEAKTILENDLSKPIPGRRHKVSESVVQDEMALFMAAASGG